MLDEKNKLHNLTQEKCIPNKSNLSFNNAFETSQPSNILTIPQKFKIKLLRTVQREFLVINNLFFNTQNHTFSHYIPNLIIDLASYTPANL